MFAKKPTSPICPLIKGECLKEGCQFWTHIMGQHPQTQSEVDMHDCAVRWLPVLMIETSKETRQAAAAVESLRNENVNAADKIASSVMHLATATYNLPNKQTKEING